VDGEFPGAVVDVMLCIALFLIFTVASAICKCRRVPTYHLLPRRSCAFAGNGLRGRGLIVRCSARGHRHVKRGGNCAAGVVGGPALFVGCLFTMCGGMRNDHKFTCYSLVVFFERGSSMVLRALSRAPAAAASLKGAMGS